MLKTPTQRRDPNAKQKKQETENQFRKQKIQLTRDFHEAFITDAGRRVLRYLMGACGYQLEDALQYTEQDLLIHSMTYNMGRRSIYLGLRKYLPLEVLIAVENQGLGDDPEEEIDIFS